MSSEPVEFSLGDQTGRLYVSDDVFQPNLTTKMLAEVADIKEGDRVLELGCGVGPLAIYAAKKGAAEVYAVDIMEQACEYARRNAELNGVADRMKVFHGSLFEPIADGKKFDIIIDDVSGMSEEISRISPWYPDTIPTGGYDGTEPTINMLTQAKNYLAEKGRLYFPLVHLSAWRKTMDKAIEIYGGVETIGEKMIPFCDEFKRSLPDLERLKDLGVIDYVSRRSRYLWCLQICRTSMA